VKGSSWQATEIPFSESPQCDLPGTPGCRIIFRHSGPTLGLIAGELLPWEMLTAERHPMLVDFRPERFSSQW
jgi:hypothetical protein